MIPTAGRDVTKVTPIGTFGTGEGMTMVIKEEIGGIEIVCETGNYYFSPKGVDRGTRLMLETVPILEGDKVLDLGCGYGVVAIYAGKKVGGDQPAAEIVKITPIGNAFCGLALCKLKSNGLPS